MAVNRPVLMLLTSVLVGVGSPALAQPEREMRIRL